MKRFTRLKGIGGSLITEKDFIVEETIGMKFLSVYSRGKDGMKKASGPYSLLKLTKEGLTTEEAINRVAKIYRINKKDIGFAGLKDRHAVTVQYITIKNFSGNDFADEKMSLKNIGAAQRPLSIGDLKGNKFEITLHSCSNLKNLDVLVSSLKEKGMPNYFGAQRFGTHGDNHIIGRHLVKGRLGAALKVINSHGKNFSGIREVGKARLKFFVNAYQSFLFNEILDAYIKKFKKPCYKYLPIVGFNTKAKKGLLGKLLQEEMNKEKITAKDFRIDSLRICCLGSSRPAFVRPEIEGVSTEGKNMKLSFSLPKGSYATVLIKELTG